MRLPTMSLALVLGLALPAVAQIGNPAGMAPGTAMTAPGQPAPHQMNTQDRLFSELAAAGGMAEVDFGKLATQKTQNASVRQFGDMMVKDHSPANDRLSVLAKPGNVPLPQELDAEHKLMRTQLERLSGAQFDVAYMQGQIVDHQKTATLLEWEISFGQDAELQRFAADTLPIVLRHLEIARDIMGQIAGQVAEAAQPAGGANAPHPERPPAPKQ